MRSDQNERGENSPEVPADGEDNIKGKIESKRTTLGSPSAGTGEEAPKQPRLLRREMQPIAVGGCRHVDGRCSDQGENIISPRVVVGVKLGETRTLTFLCEIEILQMDWLYGERSEDGQATT